MKRMWSTPLAVCATVLALAPCVLPATAAAQAYPAKPIRFLVPFTAGSGTDLIARTVGDAMSRSMGQPIVVENRPGAGGSLATAVVARGEPDGYTVLIPSSSHAVNPAIYNNLTYDTLRDLTGITPLAALPNVMVVSPARGWKSVSDVLAAAPGAAACRAQDPSLSTKGRAATVSITPNTHQAGRIE